MPTKTIRRSPLPVLVALTLVGTLTLRAPGQVNWPPSEGNKFCATAGILDTPAQGSVDFPRDTTLFAGAGPALIMSQSPSLAGLRLGSWSPTDATIDLFDGCWDDTGNFVRLEILFDNFHNPPGPIGLVDFTYDPFQFGLDPVYGWFDIDIDANPQTGGDIATFANRYLGNIARFGGLPPPPLTCRAARGGNDNDGNSNTLPPVERSGEDFHIALFGGLTTNIERRLGNNDNFFEPDEAWILTGHYLRRAQAYEMFSSANGDGTYQPLCQIEFRHFSAQNATRITLVYPLNQEGAAEQLGVDANQINTDANADNENSLFEGMLDLTTVVGLIAPGSPLTNDTFFDLISPWGNADPNDFLDPTTWQLTALVGTAYAQQDFFGALLAWTDAYPRPLLGDFTGDGTINGVDIAFFDARLSALDGVFPFDSDNSINGSVTITNFGPSFDLLDLNYDGIIDDVDRQLIIIPGDINADLHVNALDVAALVQVLIDPLAATSVCPDTTNFGACCVFTGSFDICVDTDSQSCITQGGSFSGTGTNCTVDGCPLSLGACCVSPAMFQSSCVEFPQNDCVLFGGTYLGPGTTCANEGGQCNGNTATGACCVNIGGLPPCSQQTQAECLNLGGSYQGDNTACNAATGGCPTGGGPMLAGACCLPSPIGSICQIIDENSCFANGGIYFGADTVCANVPCDAPMPPPVACCISNAQCIDTDLISCINQNGTPLSGGDTCTDVATDRLLPRADLNRDQKIDGLDIQVMVHILVGN